MKFLFIELIIGLYIVPGGKLFGSGLNAGLIDLLGTLAKPILIVPISAPRISLPLKAFRAETASSTLSKLMN